MKIHRYNSDELQKLAMQLLKTSGVTGTPTPTFQIIKALGLKIRQFSDNGSTTEYTEKSLSSFYPLPPHCKHISEISKEVKIELGLQSRIPLVRGILNVAKGEILIHKDLPESMVTFTIEHEIGHFWLPDHRKTALYQCNYFDLSRSTTKQIEREANEFAAHLRFQGDLFGQMAADYPLSLNSAIELSDKFKSSLESTFIRYVESNHKPCSLIALVRKDTPSSDGQDAPLLKTSYGAVSPTFDLPIRIHANVDIPYDDAFSRIYQDVFTTAEPPPENIESDEEEKPGFIKIPNFDKIIVSPIQRELPLIIDETEYIFNSEVFTNGYKIFILLKSYKTNKIGIEIFQGD